MEKDPENRFLYGKPPLLYNVNLSCHQDIKGEESEEKFNTKAPHVLALTPILCMHLCYRVSITDCVKEKMTERNNGVGGKE